ncbi:MAG: ferredoxin [Streptosporangiales bacterium]|nr:ferredoxin [Streptosporangiales bacterium]
MRVNADRDVCIGSGQCVLSEPRVFDQSDEDGLVLLLAADPPADTAEGVRRAVTLCPSGALSVEDDEG